MIRDASVRDVFRQAPLIAVDVVCALYSRVRLGVELRVYGLSFKKKKTTTWT